MNKGSIPIGTRRVPLLSLKEKRYTFDDIVLTKNIHFHLDRIIKEWKYRKRLKKNGIFHTRKILFCGHSGCGKTITVEALANSIGISLLFVNFYGIVSSYLGDTSSNLKKVFDYASGENCVLFFDEFDTISKSRDDVNETGEMRRVVNSLLYFLDEWSSDSLLIASTNFEKVFDHAIWRRFDTIIYFPLPDIPSIEKLINKRLYPFQLTEEYKNKIIKEVKGYSFAEIERICFDMKRDCILRGVDKVVNKEVFDNAMNIFYSRKELILTYV